MKSVYRVRRSLLGGIAVIGLFFIAGSLWAATDPSFDFAIWPLTLLGGAWFGYVGVRDLIRSDHIELFDDRLTVHFGVTSLRRKTIMRSDELNMRRRGPVLEFVVGRRARASVNAAAVVDFDDLVIELRSRWPEVPFR